MQRDADIDKKIQDFVVTEGGIILPAPSEEDFWYSDSIAWHACFYVYNVSYTQCKAILAFLDQALLESGLGQNTCQCFLPFLMTLQMPEFLLQQGAQKWPTFN